MSPSWRVPRALHADVAGCCLTGEQSVGGSMDEGDAAGDSAAEGDMPGLPLTPVAVAGASPRSLSSAEAGKVPLFWLGASFGCHIALDRVGTSGYALLICKPVPLCSMGVMTRRCPAALMSAS